MHVWVSTHFGNGCHSELPSSGDPARVIYTIVGFFCLIDKKRTPHQFLFCFFVFSCTEVSFHQITVGVLILNHSHLRCNLVCAVQRLSRHTEPRINKKRTDGDVRGDQLFRTSPSAQKMSDLDGLER